MRSWLGRHRQWATLGKQQRWFKLGWFLFISELLILALQAPLDDGIVQLDVNDLWKMKMHLGLLLGALLVKSTLQFLRK